MQGYRSALRRACKGCPETLGCLGLVALGNVTTHRENRSQSSSFQGQQTAERLLSSRLRSPTLTVDETKSRFCTRTRSRIFGRTSLIHFSVGNSYAIMSAEASKGTCRPSDGKEKKAL